MNQITKFKVGLVKPLVDRLSQQVDDDVLFEIAKVWHPRIHRDIGNRIRDEACLNILLEP